MTLSQSLSKLSPQARGRLVGDVYAAKRTLNAITPLHAGQRAVYEDRARFRVVACSRRWGKTALGAYEALFAALVLGKTVWWLAPTHAQGDGPWEGLLAATTALHPRMYINRSKRKLIFTDFGGGSIEFKTANNPANLRGAGIDLVILDEAAFMQEGVWSDVVRPMLVTTIGYALFLSTPFGGNYFSRLFSRGLDPLEPDWSSHRYTIHDAPHIPASEIAALERESTARTWQQEFLAEFLADTGAVFRGVGAAMTITPGQTPQPGARYVFGVDWGRDNDYTAIAVADATNGQIVHMERMREVGWALQRGRLMALAQVWQPDVVWAEANSIGSPNIEALQAEGLPVRPFTTTAQSKGPLIEGLALAVERGDVALVDDDVLRLELTAYTMDRLPGGGYRYSAPPGGHDDTVIAAALAWHGVSEGQVTWLLL